MEIAKIALITGANKGIGYETARALAERGIAVVIGARDVDRGRAAAAALSGETGQPVVAVQLDVTDPDSVEAAAKWLEGEYGKLDILVNNAGILLERGEAPSAMPPEMVRRTYETNVFGVVTVTNALLPLLRRAPAARIVNVSSGLGSLANLQPGMPYAAYPFLAYSSSKTAVNALTVLYANELRDTGIKVNAADPGYCATDMNGHAGPRTAAQGAIAATRLATLDDDGPSGGLFSEDGPVPW